MNLNFLHVPNGSFPCPECSSQSEQSFEKILIFHTGSVSLLIKSCYLFLFKSACVISAEAMINNRYYLITFWSVVFVI